MNSAILLQITLRRTGDWKLVDPSPQVPKGQERVRWFYSCSSIISHHWGWGHQPLEFVLICVGPLCSMTAGWGLWVFWRCSVSLGAWVFRKNKEKQAEVAARSTQLTLNTKYKEQPCSARQSTAQQQWCGHRVRYLQLLVVILVCTLCHLFRL